MGKQIIYHVTEPMQYLKSESIRSSFAIGACESKCFPPFLGDSWRLKVVSIIWFWLFQLWVLHSALTDKCLMGKWVINRCLMESCRLTLCPLVCSAFGIGMALVLACTITAARHVGWKMFSIEKETTLILNRRHSGRSRPGLVLHVGYLVDPVQLKVPCDKYPCDSYPYMTYTHWWHLPIASIWPQFSLDNYP